MKTRLALFTALMCVTATTAALEVNITNSPSRDLLIGYYGFYGQASNGTMCDVTQRERPEGNYFLFIPDECDHVTPEQIYNDAIKKVGRAAQSGHKNYEQYLQSAKTPTKQSNGSLRCLDTHSGTYIFLDAEAPNKPGWFYLDKLHSGGTLSMSIVGYWQETAEGNLVANFGINTVSVNMSNVYAC